VGFLVREGPTPLLRGCPHWAEMEDAFSTLLICLASRQRSSMPRGHTEAADRYRFAGSPSILIDGRDPFHQPAETSADVPPVLHPEGPAGAPTLEQLTEAIKEAPGLDLNYPGRDGAGCCVRPGAGRPRSTLGHGALRRAPGSAESGYGWARTTQWRNPAPQRATGLPAVPCKARDSGVAARGFDPRPPLRRVLRSHDGKASEVSQLQPTLARGVHPLRVQG